MTTIITRVFDEKQTALKARERIIARGVPGRAVTVIGPSEGNVSHERMAAAQVHPDAIETYAQAITAGKSLLVVRTTYKPLGAATMVREMLAKMNTVDLGEVVNDYYVTDKPEKAPSVLKEHPLFFTLRMNESGYEGQRMSDGLGLRLLSPRKERTSAKGRGGLKSATFWPMPLLSSKPREKSVMPGGKHMSTGFWPMPLTIRKGEQSSVIRGGDRPLSRMLGWPTRN